MSPAQPRTPDGPGGGKPGRKAPGLGGAVDLVVYYTAQDDPKRNTAVRLSKRGLARLVDDAKHIPRQAVLLNPFAKKAVSREDLPAMRRHGLVALDCSWKQADEMFPLLQGQVRSRALPFLVAAGPARFGIPFELSTAEALGAALHIAGEARQARRVLHAIPFGRTFLEVNAAPLEDYADCATSAEVVERQADYLGEEE